MVQDPQNVVYGPGDKPPLRDFLRADIPVDILAMTLSDRGQKYGPFKGHAEKTQIMKRLFQASESWSKMTRSQQEALDMIAHKIARILNGDPNYADSWVDIAGYAQLIVKELGKP